MIEALLKSSLVSSKNRPVAGGVSAAFPTTNSVSPLNNVISSPAVKISTFPVTLLILIRHLGISASVTCKSIDPEVSISIKELLGSPRVRDPPGAAWPVMLPALSTFTTPLASTDPFTMDDTEPRKGIYCMPLMEDTPVMLLILVIP
jgi:hypothetical protein